MLWTHHEIFSAVKALSRERWNLIFDFSKGFCIANRMQRAEICDNSEKHHFNLHFMIENCMLNNKPGEVYGEGWAFLKNLQKLINLHFYKLVIKSKELIKNRFSHIQANFSMEANKSPFNNGNKVNYASLYKPIHTTFVPLTTSSSSPSTSYTIGMQEFNYRE